MSELETNVSPEMSSEAAELDRIGHGEAASHGKTNGVPAGGGFQMTTEADAEASASRSLPETILGRYQVLDVVGRGAFSVVYRANQVGVGRIVALKVFRLLKSARTDPRAVEVAALRFQREGRLASSLRHPNTVTLFDYDRTESGILYMAFEFVDGPTLGEEIKRHPTGIEASRVIHIARQVAASLEEAHEKGIIHRDMKPGNIMLTRDRKDPDFTKVLDFGIAKLVEGSEEDPEYEPDHTNVLRLIDLTGVGHKEGADITLDGKIVGTPRYVPPEQIRGTELRPASDIYALGLIMHELLSGVPANPGRDPREMVEWHLTDKPFRATPSYSPPGGLAAIIRKCTRREIEARYQSCTELLEDLNRLDASGEWIKEPSRRPVLTWLLAINAVVLVVGLLVLGIWLSQGPAPEPAAPQPPPREVPAEPEPPVVPEQKAAAAEPDVGARVDAEAVIPEVRSGAVELSVSTDPTGVRVHRDGKRLGTTPFKLTIAEGDDNVVFQLRKVGYEDKDVTWTREAAPDFFPIVLERRRPGGRVDEPGVRPTEPPRGGGPSPPPTGGNPVGDGKDGKDNKYFILK